MSTLLIQGLGREVLNFSFFFFRSLLIFSMPIKERWPNEQRNGWKIPNLSFQDQSAPRTHSLNRAASLYTLLWLGFLPLDKWKLKSAVSQNCMQSIFFLNSITKSSAMIKEKAMAPHSSTLAWRIPWMEEPGRLQSMGSRRVRHDWATSLPLFTSMHWRRK